MLVIESPKIQKYDVFLSTAMDGRQEKEIDTIEALWNEALNDMPIRIKRSEKLGYDFNIGNNDCKALSSKIVESDLLILKECEGMLLDLSVADHFYVGAICEMVYAYKMHKPVVIYSGNRELCNRWWLIYHSRAIDSSRMACIKNMFKAICLLKGIKLMDSAKNSF